MAKRFALMLLLVALVFGAVFGWKYYNIQKMAAAGHKRPPATVSATQAQEDEWQDYLQTVGTLTADQGVAVSSEVPGQITKIVFDSGERVDREATLLRMDDSVDRARLDGLQAEERLAELKFKRARDLLRDNTTSRSSYDQAKASLDNARAQIASTRAVIDKKVIKAPFSGILGVRQVNLGEYLAPGQPVVTLQSLDPIHADFSIPERHLARLKTGLTVELQVRAYPDRVFTGEVTAINPGIDAATRKVKVRATLENPQQRLRPGMFAEVRLLLPQRRHVVTVEQAAIDYKPYGDSVFVIHDKNGKQIVQKRQVETGKVRDADVEIKKGLQAGDRVVLTGQVKLRNGRAVSIDNTVAPGKQQVTTP